MADKGGTDLNELLASMVPSLDPTTFVFATITSPSVADLLSLHPELISAAQCFFREREGISLILPRVAASAYASQLSANINANITFKSEFECGMITLNVHSALEAVGFMAAITKRLTEVSIGVNPVSAFYHDHLFVPMGREEQVMSVLREMMDEAKTKRIDESASSTLQSR